MENGSLFVNWKWRGYGVVFVSILFVIGIMGGCICFGVIYRFVSKFLFMFYK